MMNTTVTTGTGTAPAFLADLTNIRVVWARKLRMVEGTSYDRAANAFVDVVKQEAYAERVLGYTGQDVHGQWTAVDDEGWILADDLPNHVSATVAARRAFGPVIVA